MSDIKMCANGCGFFGNILYKNYCSKCYKDTVEEPVEEKLPEPKDNTPEEKLPEPKDNTPEENPDRNKKRCYLETCNRKVPLAFQYECRCKNIYCRRHKNEHNCSYDYLGEHQNKIRENNPNVSRPKVEQI